MMRRLLGAIQFLTVIPVRARTAPLGSSAVFFPLVGAAIGAAGGLLLETGRGYFPFTLLSLLVLGFWILVTGASQEAAFAHCADGILHDRSIGPHGVIGFVLLILVRWQALASIAVDPIPGLAAALALSHSAVVGLLWSTSPVGDDSAARASETLSTPAAVVAIALGVVFVLLPGGRIASILLGGSIALVLLARGYFTRRIGGVTEHCLGATALIVETWCLIVYTCRPCTL
jgi:adenosylcobinamide-GDP ribazoletransferase